ncbi:MAG: TRAP transporter substrate-binding protein [Gemmatimonadetes bacterium]|nr:TRAP transporter substrate-binding protein [Gemmatimonadota bacterium]
MTPRLTIRAAAIPAAAFLVVACGGAEAGFSLRLGHDQTDGHPYDLAVEDFARRVQDATGGAVHISVFPAAQLGDSPEQIEGLYLGTLDLVLAAFSHASQFCPELGVFGLPYLFDDEAHFAAVFDGDIGAELDETCADRYAIRLLSTFTSGYRVLFNNRRPIENPADLKGLKVRVMGGPADARAWEAFGAIPVPMPYSEVYSALQAGVIDGAENEAVSILSNRFYEAARHIAPTNHLVLPMGLFISEQTMNRLPEPWREILRVSAREAAIAERELMVARNAAALTGMQQRYGVTVSTLDVASLRAASLELQDRLAVELGLHDLLERVRAAAR